MVLSTSTSSSSIRKTRTMMNPHILLLLLLTSTTLVLNTSTSLLLHGCDGFSTTSHHHAHTINNRQQHTIVVRSSSSSSLSLSSSESVSTVQRRKQQPNSSMMTDVTSSSVSSSLSFASSIEEMTCKFQSYGSNIARSRRRYKHHQQTGSSSSSSSSYLTAVRSLLHTLQTQTLSLQTITQQQQQQQQQHNLESIPIASSSSTSSSNKQQQQITKTNTQDQFINTLNRTLLQALGAAADCGDYALLLKLVTAAVEYARAIAAATGSDDGVASYGGRGGVSSDKEYGGNNEGGGGRGVGLAVLESRFFGTAIVELTRTKASHSKLKKIWNLFLSLASSSSSSSEEEARMGSTDGGRSTTGNNGNVLATPPSAFELTAMIQGLASRNRIRAALDLYHKHAAAAAAVVSDEVEEEEVNKRNNKGRQSSSSSSSSSIVVMESDEYTASLLFTILADSIDREDGGMEFETKMKNKQKNKKKESEHEPKTTTTTTTTTSSKQQQQQKYLESFDSSSPCWQWREAETLLDDFERRNKLNNYSYSAALKVNERASEKYSRSGASASISTSDGNGDGDVVVRRHHQGAKFAFGILERMKSKKYPPDVVTCSAVMSAFDKGHQWKAAKALLHTMEKGYDDDDDDNDNKNNIDNDYLSSLSSEYKSERKEDAIVWKLPPPNEYTYATAISSCARCGQYEEAIQIVDSMRSHSNATLTATATLDSKLSQRSTQISGNDDDDDGDDDITSRITKVSPNTWVYNSVLSACSTRQPTSANNRSDKKESKKRMLSALDTIQQMEKDADAGADTAPDTVTYNTLLAVAGNFEVTFKGITNNFNADEENTERDTSRERFIYGVLEKMETRGLRRDSITYRNAIMAVGETSDVAVAIVNKAFNDSQFMDSLQGSWGSTSRGKAYLLNAALAVGAKHGNMNLMVELFDMLKLHGIPSDTRSMQHLIKSLGSSGNCKDSMFALNAMKGDIIANNIFLDKYGIDIVGSGMDDERLMIEEGHYSAAITACYRHGEHFMALKILQAMQLHDLTPNDGALQGIVHAYCKLAIDAAHGEFKKARKKKLKLKSNKPIKVRHKISNARATIALSMMKSLKDPPMKLQSAVASACTASGMWNEARDVLRIVHFAALQEKKLEKSSKPVQSNRDSALAELPRLHSSLLKLSARSGDVTAALCYVEAIQSIALKLSRVDNPTLFSAQSLSEGQQLKDLYPIPGSEGTLDTGANLGTPPSYQHNHKLGMKGEDWHLLMIAASKSAHWKVCVGTLQFIQPFVEQTHPRNAEINSTDTSVSKELYIEYEKLANALTVATLAFETRSQYAWALRTIEDWIEWSGRRPRKESVFSACRILAARGQCNEVTSLIKRVLLIPPCIDEVKTYNNGSRSYETSIYTAAITALHKHGFYDNADELYANAITGGFLPSAIIENDEDEMKPKLDLHGMSLSIAHAAVRVSLQHLIRANTPDTAKQDVVIVTGRGKRSLRYLRPVLRPEVQRMLLEEFYPPLSTYSARGNMGALIVPSTDIIAWNTHQQRQKSYHFLAIADVLKSISSGNRLRNALLEKIKNRENFEEPL